jgi:hypothetical protein
MSASLYYFPAGITDPGPAFQEPRPEYPAGPAFQPPSRHFPALGRLSPPWPSKGRNLTVAYQARQAGIDQAGIHRARTSMTPGRDRSTLACPRPVSMRTLPPSIKTAASASPSTYDRYVGLCFVLAILHFIQAKPRTRCTHMPSLGTPRLRLGIHASSCQIT